MDQSFSDELRLFLREQNISQARFARSIRTDSSIVRAWMRGDATPSAATRCLFDLLFAQPWLFADLERRSMAHELSQ